ncbi:hypothetical protein QBC37DRAFT_371775 [Rhypophila decipiens]|uniref:Uncharacterized protein n=1 Tax=Rhypophila decipiens TaxID=261697 RepID=A0AAN7BC90_9PEZI|nr:hypothetical protein QBC37DRAFT_371775 [Rhypophila decipiens]
MSGVSKTENEQVIMSDAQAQQQQHRDSETTLTPPDEASSPTLASSAPAGRDRRGSDEWDASKVPPSRFQKRKGSIYAVPGSRDGHVDRNYAHKFHEKHAEKGYGSTIPATGAESGKK